jgi:membrane protease YdiL (CAAX protease family)
MPHAAREFPLFAALACTAGLCEEFLFRGYLLWYAVHFMPFAYACVAQALVFGACHAYQGRRGIVLTTLAGAFFTGVLLVAGSIWPSMLIHALMDLHAGDLARRVFPPELEPVTGAGEPA